MYRLPDSFKNEMDKIVHDWKHDPEICHSKMDNLMCELLIALGYGAGVRVFDKTTKYYA